jgi:predicted dehydrogenase
MRSNEALTRRSLLTGAALAAGTAACRRTPTAEAHSGDLVRFGMVGTGDQGTFLLKRLQGVANGHCVALCDNFQPNLEKGLAVTGTSPKTYNDYRALLDDPQVEAVLVATPLYKHFEVTRAALEAGKHVFCEKCLVFKPEEIDALRQMCAARPRQVLQTGLQRRYSPFYKAARQMIEKGLLGEVTHVRAQWHRNSSWRKPLPDPKLERQIHWRLYREFSGGLTSELASHQIDVADWMFGARPEFVTGVGGTDFYKDGRDIHDNIQLIFQYPKGRKLLYSAISTNSFLPLFNGTRPQFGEEIMGTGGTIQITIGDAANPAVGPALAMWYLEPNPPKIEHGAAKKESLTAGPTIPAGLKLGKGLPLLLPSDEVQKNDPFLVREQKYAKLWLYQKGIVLPEEDRNPVDLSLEDFFACLRTGRKPVADLEIGLSDSIGVMAANLAMDEGRRVSFQEFGTKLAS